MAASLDKPIRADHFMHRMLSMSVKFAHAGARQASGRTEKTVRTPPTRLPLYRETPESSGRPELKRTPPTKANQENMSAYPTLRCPTPAPGPLGPGRHTLLPTIRAHIGRCPNLYDHNEAGDALTDCHLRETWGGECIWPREEATSAQSCV